ncbi:MAG: TIM barrel protein [Bacteroidota bacterium]
MSLLNRRRFTQQALSGALGASLLPVFSQPKTIYPPKIKQVIAAWPFMNLGDKWSAEQLVHYAKEMGFAGVELLDPIHWPLLKANELVCAATKSHTFIRGMNNTQHHAECLDILTKSIEASMQAGYPNVMTFTGLADTRSEKNGSIVSPEEARKNCIAGYKKIVSLAEEKGVTLILEPLNTKVSENMKGHPGYTGDHIDLCMDIIKAVGSPNFKLLFDVYHIQIMDGDIIRHIQEYGEYIGHVQVAGVPGRGEIGLTQEIYYPAVMQALVDIGYTGYVGHEWIPTGDPKVGLKEAFSICDI